VGNLHLASKGAPAAAPSSGAPPPLYNPEEIAGIVPADARQTYDVRDVIARVVDGSEFDEFKKLYGPVSLRQFAAKLILHIATNPNVSLRGDIFRRRHFAPVQWAPLPHLRNAPCRKLHGFVRQREKLRSEYLIRQRHRA
jgi:hypothetical protein